MFVDEGGLKLSDKELRAFLIMKVALLNWECYYTCKSCKFEDEGSCMVKNVGVELDTLFKELIL